MKTTKLVIGIVCILLAIFVFIESSLAGLGNAIANNNEAGGGGGIILSFCYLAAGIVGISTLRGGNGGYVSAGILIVGGAIGLMTAGSYKDLNIWGWLAIIFGVIYIIATRRGLKPEAEE